MHLPLGGQPYPESIPTNPVGLDDILSDTARIRVQGSSTRPLTTDHRWIWGACEVAGLCVGVGEHLLQHDGINPASIHAGSGGAHSSLAWSGPDTRGQSRRRQAISAAAVELREQLTTSI